jgi:recombination protein RecA
VSHFGACRTDPRSLNERLFVDYTDVIRRLCGAPRNAVTPPLYGAQQTSLHDRHEPPSGGEQARQERMSTDQEHAKKALEMALAQVEKQYGKGAIMRMGEKTTMNIETIPTGALSLDLALGVGGLPRGRVTEIFGPESSGKSTLAMHVVAEAQRNGGVCAYIDAEHAMDPTYAKAIGVDIDQLLISQPDTGEQALEIADMLVRSGALDVVVIDSVAALTPRAEIEGEMGDSHVGLQARLMSQALRKLTANLNKSKTIMVFINQLREKIGVMFGSPETTPGGRALKFYSSVRLDIRRIESIKDGAEVIGNRTRVKVVKNKVSPPFKTAEFDIMYGKGVSREGSLLDMAVDMAIIKKSGAWFTYEGEQLGQGRENAKTFLASNPEIMVEISDKVLTMAGLRPGANSEVDAVTGEFSTDDDTPIELD